MIGAFDDKQRFGIAGGLEDVYFTTLARSRAAESARVA